jgi:hypothetical protein
MLAGPLNVRWLAGAVREARPALESVQRDGQCPQKVEERTFCGYVLPR